MKKLISFIILLSLTFIPAQSQSKKTTHKKETQNFICFSPSKVKKINGLNVKFWDVENNQQQVNGLELGINPLTVFFPFLTLIHSPDIIQQDPESILSNRKAPFKKINGIQLSIGSIEKAIINGLEVNLSGNFNTISNGVSISPILNKHYKVSGLSFSVIGNLDYKVRGIQIGLFNKSKDLRGIQIGLWNKNSKRSLPFINWNFKS